MPTMIFTYSAKPGVPAETFEQFIRDVDQPATLKLPSALSSRIFRIKGAGAAFQYLEVLEVTSLEAFAEDGKRPELGPIMEQWKDVGAVDDIKVYQCEEWYAARKQDFIKK